MVAVAFEAPISGIDVLLAEDDALYRRALVRLLTHAGHRAHEASDPTAALELLRARPEITHAVIDLQLGEHSGLHLLKLLRAERESLRCILLSAFTSTVVAVEAIRLGAYNCLPKTIGTDALLVELCAGPAGPNLEEIPVPSLSQVEWDHIQRVLHDCQGNVSLAARKLGIHRQSLQRKLRRYAPIK